MKSVKLPKIKFFKFTDSNSKNDRNTLNELEDRVNDFISSDEVSSVVDIKFNTDMKRFYSEHSMDTNVYCMVIYIPKTDKKNQDK